MNDVYWKILIVDDLFKNTNLLNNQNYVINKKIKKRVILNFIQIKTKVNWRDIVKYHTLWKYKIINFNEIKKENLINNFIFLSLPLFFLLLWVFLNDITFFSRLLLIWFSVIFIFLFLKTNHFNYYVLLRDKNLVYVKNKK